MEEFEDNQGEDASSVIKSIMVEQEEKTRESVDPLVVMIGAVNALKDREREVLLVRFGLEDSEKMTLEAVGAKFGVTRERVRQIENTAIQKLATKPSKDLTRLLKVVHSYLAEMGGVASLDGLADYFRVETDQRREASMNALRLAMTLDDAVITLPKSDGLKIGWMKKSLSIELIEQVLHEAEKILAIAGKPLSEEKIWEGLTNSQLYTNNRSVLTPSMVGGALRVGARMAQVGEDWGLVAWPTVVPKRIRDKVYLILRKSTRPMHFRDIADAINQAYSGKPVLSRTVHNELIGDTRFVLIGRGIYGLKEWGYQPGVVSDVIIKVLKQSGHPMTIEEIIGEVLKDRQVKRNTVVANLQNKELFAKVSKGMYDLVKT